MVGEHCRFECGDVEDAIEDASLGEIEVGTRKSGGVGAGAVVTMGGLLALGGGLVVTAKMLWDWRSGSRTVGSAEE